MKYHIFGHIKTVLTHKHYVFIYCCKCGIPFRGFVHDFSKFSPSEFFPSSKYYQGTSSPILVQRQSEEGYSSITVHHTNKNKHHFEYWIDLFKGDLVLKQMPYKYAIEYVCDVIAASKTYNKKNFKRNLPLDYFNQRKDRYLMAKGTKEFVTKLFEEYRDFGFKKLKKKYTKKLYQEISKKYSQTETIPLFSIKNYIN